MKKLWLSFLSGLIFLNFSYAQNTFPTPSGAVGIGTTSPASGLMLDVIGNGSFSGALSLGLGGGGTNVFQQTLAHNYNGIPYVSYPGQFRWYASPNNSLYKDNALFQLRSWDAGTNTENTMATFTGGGNFGIGTTTPGAKLHIVEDASSGATALKLTNRNNIQTFGLAVDVGAVDDGKFMIYNANNSTPNFVIDNAGKVGIGTTSPQNILHVNGGISSTSGGPISSATPSANLYYDAANDKSVLYSFQPTVAWKPILFGASTFSLVSYGANQGLFQDANGYVGIGTTTPGNKLEVLGSAIINPNSSVGNFTEGIRINNANNNFAIVHFGGAAGSTNNTGSGQWDVLKNSDNHFGIWENGNAMFSILNTSGYVGVGRTDPQAKFHLYSNGSTSNATNQYSGDMIIQGNPGNRTSTTGASLEFVIPANSDGSNPWGQGRIITVAGIDNSTYNATGKMILGTRRSFDKGVGTGVTWNYGDDLVIDGSGNVAIGTTDPKGYKLAVAGNAIAEQMTVKLQADWPDYIFKKDYTLMPLGELSNYVNKNHHLPEIPSAAEIKKDGLNLGEMNSLLVKKVEELTLYLIEKEKEIRDLKADKQAKDEQDKQQNERLKKLEEQLDALLKGGKQ